MQNKAWLMENIGPVVLFLLYLVISAWAKQKKNQGKKAAKEQRQEVESIRPKQTSQIGSILDQLKKELFEVEETPDLPFDQYHDEPVEEVVAPEDYPEPQFMEGSGSLEDHDHKAHLARTEPSPAVVRGNPLKGILKAYSTTQQGIILREILGKPRAYQDNKDWFFNS